MICPGCGKWFAREHHCRGAVAPPILGRDRAQLDAERSDAALELERHRSLELERIAEARRAQLERADVPLVGEDRTAAIARVRAAIRHSRGATDAV